MKKPLNGKAYGSIPHLVGSRLGPGDHHITQGQTDILTTTGRKGDVVYVHEKMDGSNVAVAKLPDSRIVALGRAGYPAASSPYLQHRIFSDWVYSQAERFDALLWPGSRICGEWLAQAHGTRYELIKEPFVAFDIFSPRNVRIPTHDFQVLVQSVNINAATLINDGSLMDIASVERWLQSGDYTLPIIDGIPEGAVWRVEVSGKVDFLAKYVRHDFVPGRFLEERNGAGKPIWNEHLMSWLPQKAIQRIKQEG